MAVLRWMKVSNGPPGTFECRRYVSLLLGIQHSGCSRRFLDFNIAPIMEFRRPESRETNISFEPATFVNKCRVNCERSREKVRRRTWRFSFVVCVNFEFHISWVLIYVLPLYGCEDDKINDGNSFLSSLTLCVKLWSWVKFHVFNQWLCKWIVLKFTFSHTKKG